MKEAGDAYTMNVGVIGVGGVGGYFGGKLTQLLKKQEYEENLKIFFVARNQHLKEIKKHGLILDAVTDGDSENDPVNNDREMTCYPTLATDKISDLPPLDLCLICVKGYDLQNVLVPLKPKISENTMILPLLNGVDIYERIRSVITTGIVYPSCVYVGTHIERPGKVTQRGGTCTIHFGDDPKNNIAQRSVDPKLFELLDQAKIKYNWSENAYTEIWSKYIFIAAFGTVTANFNKTVGEVMASKELSRYVKGIMGEIYRIAEAKKVSLPETIIEESYLKGLKFPFDTKTSFQRDYEQMEKSDERDLFGGAIIRMGEKLDIPTETTALIYQSIQSQKNLCD